MANSKVNRGRPVLGLHYYIVRAQFKIRNNLECRTFFFPITLTNMVTRLPPKFFLFFFLYFRTALDKMCFPRKVINGTRNFLVLEVPSLRSSHVMNFVFFFFYLKSLKKITLALALRRMSPTVAPVMTSPRSVVPEKRRAILFQCRPSCSVIDLEEGVGRSLPFSCASRSRRISSSYLLRRSCYSKYEPGQLY